MSWLQRQRQMTKKGKAPIQVPFDKDGNQLEFASYYSNAKLRPNFEFDGKLTYERCARGRSACDFYFRNKDGMGVVFRLAEFERIIPHMVNGKVVGRFTFNKRGENFSCSVIDPSESE